VKKDNKISLFCPEKDKNNLDELVRMGAQMMLRLAIEAEITNYLEDNRDNRLGDGKPVIVRNGYHRERQIAVGAGIVSVKVPRTRNRNQEPEHFTSSIIPPYIRRSLKIDEAIPLLYLRGLSNGDMLPCLEKLLGKGISGLSPANITRLKRIWGQEHDSWQKRDLSDKEYCYIWIDGIHFNVRIGEARLCILVVIGATREGKKELIAVEGGYRESSESWGSLLRSLKARGLKCPKLVIGDGALGFRDAVKDIFPSVRWQRCWVHKTVNVLDKLPKSVQSQAKSMLHEIYMAKSKADAQKAFSRFIHVFQDKYPKAVQCLQKDAEHLLTFYDFPAKHWSHIRSTNVIESPFATVRLRTDKTRGQGTLQTTLFMVFKLLEQASGRWQRLAGYKLIGKVISGVIFIDGKEDKKAA
jgi:transposase-like protein